MIRNLIILAFVTIALALLRSFIKQIISAVTKSLAADPEADQSAGAKKQSPPRGGHMVRDPVTGTYIDETLALKEKINGEWFFFESKQTRDQYVRERRSG